MRKDENRLNVLRLEKPLSLEQKTAILEKGHVLVSASAGSGKTFTMINKIMLALCEDVPLKDMIILVYNESVASELKEKLHDSLYKLICSSDGDLKKKLLDDLDSLPICHISTIHSFCKSLIKDNFDKIGISPTYKVLDEKEHKEYMQIAIDNVLQNYYTSGDDEVFDQVVDIFSKGRKEENLKDNIFKLFNLMYIQANKEDFIKNVNECFEMNLNENKYSKKLLEYYQNMFKKYVDVLEDLSKNKMLDSAEKIKMTLFVYIDRLHDFIKDSSLKELVEDCKKGIVDRIPGNYIRDKESPEYLYANYVKSYLAEIKDVLTKDSTGIVNIFDNDYIFEKKALIQNQTYVNKLIEIVLNFDKELKEIKLKDNALSFDDLLHYAAVILEENPSLVTDYKAVFVDEYQDVNPIQETIINQLIKGVDSSFLVGDVKQSIYAFRLADPQIFINRKELYVQNDGAGTPIFFNANFRSNKCVLNFVNEVFNSSMKIENADIDYEKEAQFNITNNNQDGGHVSIHFFKEKNLGKTPCNGVYDITNHVDSEVKIKGEETEGKFIAREIKSLVNHETIDGRPLEFGDIVLLFRSRKGAKPILQAIKNQGIPVDESTFLEKDSSPERELMNYLRVIDNPLQDIPLAGFLLSYFGGYTEEELYLISKIEDYGNLYNKFISYSKKGDELAKKIKVTLEMLEEYRIKSSFKSVSELMSGIVSDYSYDAYLMKDGEDSVYGLKAFIESVANKEDVSLGKFVETYVEDTQKDIKTSNNGFVHVSTFHAYKGLESPVVFVCDVAKLFNNQENKSDLIEKGNGYIGLKYFDFLNRKKYKSLSFIGIENYCKQNAIKEEMRLFYVALTRAKKYMYITGSVNKDYETKFGKEPLIKGFNSYIDFISLAKFEGKLSIEEKYHDADEFDSVVETKIRPDYKVGVKEIADAIKEAQKYKYQNEKASNLQIKYSVTALDSIDEPVVSVYEEATKVGILYHKVMQHINLECTTLEDIKKNFEKLVEERYFSQEEMDSIDPTIIQKCLQSEVMLKTRDAYNIYREKGFMMYKPAKDILDDVDDFEGVDDKVLVQGVVDLYIEGEQNIIVDFKYARFDNPKTLKKYEKQLKLYKNAIESTNSAKIDRIVLYSFIEGKQHEVKID